MRHTMGLQQDPFGMIKSGEKTVELRLYDEKRQRLQVGDEIEFENQVTGEKLLVRVTALHLFASFEELYAALPLLQCGYTEETLPSAHYTDMEAYYPPSEQKKYGVVGIGISKL